MARPIAFGITDLDIGGAELNLVRLVEGLDPTQWRSSVVCVKPEGPLAERLRAMGACVESLNVRGIHDVPRALREWTAILRRERPVLLQTMLFHANLLGRFVAPRAGVPKLLAGLRVAEKRRNLHVAFDRWTRGRVDGYICVSEGVADFARRQILVDPLRVHVVPNGVDVDAADLAIPIARNRFHANAGDTVLMCVGRLDRQKSPMDLLEAVDLLRQRGNPLLRSSDLDGRAKLVVVYVGEGPLRGDLERAVRSKGLERNVCMVGWQQDVFAWLKAADGLVLPSLWEGMANALLEAMACRLPVVATDVEGSRELLSGRPQALLKVGLESTGNGWRVAPGRPDLLADAIAELANDQGRRDRGAVGRRLVEGRFSIAAMVSAYDQIFRATIGGSAD